MAQRAVIVACRRRFSALNSSGSPAASFISAAIARSAPKSAGVSRSQASAVAAPSRIATAVISCSQVVASAGATIAPTFGWKRTQPSASSRRSASRTGMVLTPSSRASASMLSRASGPSSPEWMRSRRTA
ncbi:MAG TPA: hypothetical protein VF060_32070 [Trebonia sp.]